MGEPGESVRVENTTVDGRCWKTPILMLKLDSSVNRVVLVWKFGLDLETFHSESIHEVFWDTTRHVQLWSDFTVFTVHVKSRVVSDAAQDRTCTVRAVVRSGHRTTARAVKKNWFFFLSLFVPLWPLSSSLLSPDLLFIMKRWSES